MTKVVTFNGIAYDVSDAANFFVFVPDGETEAHVFINGRFISKRSDFESEWLTNAMKTAEAVAQKRNPDCSNVISALNSEVQGLKGQVLGLTARFEQVEVDFQSLIKASIRDAQASYVKS